MPEEKTTTGIKVSKELANYTEAKTKADLKKIIETVKKEVKPFEKNKAHYFQCKTIENASNSFDETPEKNFNALLEYTGIAVSQLNYLLNLKNS